MSDSKLIKKLIKEKQMEKKKERYLEISHCTSILADKTFILAGNKLLAWFKSTFRWRTNLQSFTGDWTKAVSTVCCIQPILRTACWLFLNHCCYLRQTRLSNKDYFSLLWSGFVLWGESFRWIRIWKSRWKTFTVQEEQLFWTFSIRKSARKMLILYVVFGIFNVDFPKTVSRSPVFMIACSRNWW